MPSHEAAIAEQDLSIVQTLERNEARLRGFIRRRVLDAADVEDILQDVFSELIEAYRLLKPAEQITAWLYRVARNRITDLFRRRRTVSLDESADADADGRTLADLLPSPEDGPDAIFARKVLVEALDDALLELPANQREVFVAHEFEGRSFKQISAETGISVNTLLSRKRYAVLHLRRRLQQITEEYGTEN